MQITLNLTHVQYDALMAALEVTEEELELCGLNNFDTKGDQRLIRIFRARNLLQIYSVGNFSPMTNWDRAQLAKQHAPKP